MRTNAWLIVAVMAGLVSGARADLIQYFDGYGFIQEVAVSGLESSYYSDTKLGQPVTGPTTGTLLPIFGPNPVTYPSPVGPVPSPGGAVGKHFDQGVLGMRIDGGQITFSLASGMNAQTGYYYTGWQTYYSQGDLFIDVRDSGGLRHLALLSAWARNSDEQPINLNNGHFDAAQAYHTAGGAGAGSLEGHLVALHTNADVTLVGGRGSYYAAIAPSGLDLRTFACGGTDLGYANLAHASVSDFGQTWYIQTWTVQLTDLSNDANFDVALHAAVSCGNDQIGGTFNVPEPSSLLLVAAGIAGLRITRRPS